jgi:predicted glycoside hydrolase/deacetylase ChbG (UPF0249 family)
MIRISLLLMLLAFVAYGQESPDWTVEQDDSIKKIRLIIRGDDIGFTHASNLALEQAFENGIMTSASVMSGAPWFTETAEIIRDHPEWNIGLHLALTSGYDKLNWGPLASVSEVKSLVAEDGNLYLSYPDAPLSLFYIEEAPYLYSSDKEMPAKALERRRSLTSSKFPDINEVEIEFRAQILRAQKLGVKIDYLDCHMGVGCNPQLISVMIKLAEELCVPIPERDWMGTVDFWEAYDGDIANNALKLANKLDALKPGTYRLVLHPTVDNEESRATDSYFGVKGARSGQNDLNILLSEEVKAAIKRNDIELISVGDLWDYNKCKMKVIPN